MAQPSNTFDSYDANGIREDLENVIYNISPEETPFYSSLKKTSASNTLHEINTLKLKFNMLPSSNILIPLQVPFAIFCVKQTAMINWG